jgi:hypothetical protein
MQPGDASLAFIFVPRPVPPLTPYTAILDLLTRSARLEAALATLGTTCCRILVVHDSKREESEGEHRDGREGEGGQR